METSKALKHNILMVENKSGNDRRQYPNVIDTYTQDGQIVLCMDNGDKQTFPASGWTMYDFSPTLGWNKSAVLPEQLSNKHQIRINFVRRRDCEDEFYFDDLYLVVDDETYKAKDLGKPKTTGDFLLEMAESWLSTPDGWAENCHACNDYNWGDFVMSLPLSACGAELRDCRDIFIKIDCVVNISANQDEHLAPVDVEAEVFIGDTLQGTALVDFQDGTVDINLTNGHEDIPDDIDTITVHVRDNEFTAVRKEGPFDGWELEDLYG